VSNSRGGDSDIGQCTQDLVSGAKRTLAMTGTLFNGLARGLFYLLYRFSTDFRQLYQHDESALFASHHGLIETVTVSKSGSGRTGYSGYGRNEDKSYTREAPGATPQMVGMLAPITCWLTLRDIGIDLPPRTEYVVPVQLHALHQPGIRALAGIESAAKASMMQSDTGRSSLHSQWFYAALGWPDHPTAETLAGIYTVPEIPELVSGAVQSPKDIAVLNLVDAETARGRGVAIFFEQVIKRNAMPRVQKILEAAGHYVAVLDTRIGPADRMPWIDRHYAEALKSGRQMIMLANGNLVKEGVDLLMFPTIVEFGQHYDILELLQRLARSHRLGQTRPVDIYFMYYERTQQEKALHRIARKVKASKQIDGHVAGGLSLVVEEEDFIQDSMRAADEAEGTKLSDLLQVRHVDDTRRTDGAGTMPKMDKLGSAEAERDLAEQMLWRSLMQTPSKRATHPNKATPQGQLTLLDAIKERAAGN
jgi:hypothetical protein